MTLPWDTPGLMDRLAALCKEPLTAKVIAEMLSSEFQLDVTRNAVIGRIHRHGLQLHFEPKFKPGSNPGRPRKSKPDKQVKMVKLHVDAPIAPEEAARPSEAEALTIYQLQRGDCRWPLGRTYQRPPYLYCGKQAVFERPYCGEHCVKAYGSNYRP